MGVNKTWNQFVVKKENKSLVLQTIKTRSSLSRADTAYTLDCTWRSSSGSRKVFKC